MKIPEKKLRLAVNKKLLLGVCVCRAFWTDCNLSSVKRLEFVSAETSGLIAISVL